MPGHSRARGHMYFNGSYATATNSNEAMSANRLNANRNSTSNVNANGHLSNANGYSNSGTDTGQEGSEARLFVSKEPAVNDYDYTRHCTNVNGAILTYMNDYANVPAASTTSGPQVPTHAHAEEEDLTRPIDRNLVRAEIGNALAQATSSSSDGEDARRGLRALGRRAYD